MLGVVMASERGLAGDLLAETARRLQAGGFRLAGAVQENTGDTEMLLRLLAAPGLVRISQNLGPGAQGCRLDPDGLERAVAGVQAALEGADLVIINKFGKQEAEGRGFRPLIAEALSLGIPVLTTVAPDHADAFARFAQDMSEPVPARLEAILDWCASARQS
jgi:hypothetical protein